MLVRNSRKIDVISSNPIGIYALPQEMTFFVVSQPVGVVIGSVLRMVTTRRVTFSYVLVPSLYLQSAESTLVRLTCETNMQSPLIRKPFRWIGSTKSRSVQTTSIVVHSPEQVTFPVLWVI